MTVTSEAACADISILCSRLAPESKRGHCRVHRKVINLATRCGHQCAEPFGLLDQLPSHYFFQLIIKLIMASPPMPCPVLLKPSIINPTPIIKLLHGELSMISSQSFTSLRLFKMTFIKNFFTLRHLKVLTNFYVLCCHDFLLTSLKSEK